MNVLYVNKVSPRLGGGAEKRILEIGRRLSRRGHTIHVLCAKTQPGLPDREAFKGLRIHYMKTIPGFLFAWKTLSFYLSRYLFYPLCFWKAYQICRTKAIDVIVDDISPSLSLVYWVGRLLRIPVAAHIYEIFGLNWFRLKDPVTAVLGCFVEQVLLRSWEFDAYMTASSYMKQRLISLSIPKDKITVVPLGITLSDFEGRETKPNRSHVQLISLSRLVKQKGHIYLLDAIKYLVESESTEVQLSVIGYGPLLRELKSYVETCGLESYVEFLGPVYGAPKRELLLDSDIFVHPSLQEGYGIVLLEAMACGLPIVASELPVFDFFEDGKNGFLVEKANSRAIAEGLLRLIRNDAIRVRISKHNLNHVRRFDWDYVVDQEEAFLEGMATSRPR